jgi:hypothetical protein
VVLGWNDTTRFHLLNRNVMNRSQRFAYNGFKLRRPCLTFNRPVGPSCGFKFPAYAVKYVDNMYKLPGRVLHSFVFPISSKSRLSPGVPLTMVSLPA